MSVIYGNANYRRKFDAFRIIDESKKNPLVEMMSACDKIEDPAARAAAWDRVCAYVYAKPKVIESSPDDSVKNSERAAEVLKMMEEAASATSNRARDQGIHPARMDNGTTQVQAQSPTDPGV